MSIFDKKEGITDDVDYISKFPGEETDPGSFHWECPDKYLIIYLMISGHYIEKRSVHTVEFIPELLNDNTWAILLFMRGTNLEYNHSWRESQYFNIRFRTKKDAVEGIHFLANYMKTFLGGLSYHLSQIMNAWLYRVSGMDFPVPTVLLDNMNIIK